ncbi:magnesium transporter NIPA-domain-containing protein [Chytriomyces cf. hyalinus JEL632]|nr:magnesium transporter NIPA-domain-containing protein [Chytriomyces cf. hyalinus JEL632]
MSDTAHKTIGITLAVASGAFIGTSFILKKKGLIEAAKTHGDIGNGHAYLSNSLWWIGLVLMALGEACNFAAYAFVPAILVTPLGALSVVISAVLSSIFLKERLNLTGKIGCAQCVLGATIIVINAPETSATETMAEFFAFVVAPGFLVYSVVLLLGIFYLIHRVSPRYGSKHPIVYISICSLIGSFLVVAIQGFGSAIVYSSSHWTEHNQFKEWTLYILLSFILLAVVAQIHFLNRALNSYSTAIVTPVYYVSFTTATLCTSAVLFQGFRIESALQGIMIVAGFLVIVGGVVLLFEFNSQMMKEKAMDLACAAKDGLYGNGGKADVAKSNDDEAVYIEEDVSDHSVFCDSVSDDASHDLLEFSDDDKRDSAVRRVKVPEYNTLGLFRSFSEIKAPHQDGQNRSYHLQSDQSSDFEAALPPRVWANFLRQTTSSNLTLKSVSMDESTSSNEMSSMTSPGNGACQSTLPIAPRVPSSFPCASLPRGSGYFHRHMSFSTASDSPRVEEAMRAHETRSMSMNCRPTPPILPTSNDLNSHSAVMNEVDNQSLHQKQALLTRLPALKQQSKPNFEAHRFIPPHVPTSAQHTFKSLNHNLQSTCIPVKQSTVHSASQSPEDMSYTKLGPIYQRRPVSLPVTTHIRQQQQCTPYLDSCPPASACKKPDRGQLRSASSPEQEEGWIWTNGSDASRLRRRMAPIETSAMRTRKQLQGYLSRSIQDGQTVRTQLRNTILVKLKFAPVLKLRLIGIWLEHLRLEAMASNENGAEIRDKYKYLKSRVGSSSAQMFVQWAQFEASHGDIDRAKSILNAGIDVKADPVALLEKNLVDLNNGVFKPDTIPSPRIPSKLNRVHSITQDFQTRINPGIPAKESMTPVQKMQALLAGLKKSINQPPSPMEETKTLVHSDLNMSHLNSNPLSKLENTCDSKLQNSCDSLAAKRPELLSETNETKVAAQDTSVTDVSPVAVISAKQSEETEFLMPVKTGEESPSPPRKINHSKSDTSSVTIPDVGHELSQQSAKSNLLISVNGVPYKRIELIGRGASSKVYKVISESGRIFALKKVKLDRQDPSAIEGYLNEIELLKKLANSKAIISMIDSEICFSKKKHLLLLLEYGEIDLAHLLLKDKSLIGNLNFIRMNWTQMLQAVQQIHNEKIVHSDLKPANFLIVEGALKLIDFGIAKAIPNDTTNVQRDYQTGTLNYMAPEAILFTESNSSKGHLKLGRASDIWSLGCILYQLVYGQPPFSSLPIVQKLNAIVDPNYVIQFKDVGDAALLDVMKSCLNRDPKARMTIPQLLAHPFLNPSVGVSGKVALTKSDILEILMAGQDMRGSGKSAVDLAELYFEQFTERHRSSQRRQ